MSNPWENIYEIVKEDYTKEQIFSMNLDELYELLDKYY